MLNLPHALREQATLLRMMASGEIPLRRVEVEAVARRLEEIAAFQARLRESEEVVGSWGAAARRIGRALRG